MTRIPTKEEGIYTQQVLQQQKSLHKTWEQCKERVVTKSCKRITKPILYTKRQAFTNDNFKDPKLKIAIWELEWIK
jgi:hypothetical protein